MLYRDLPRRTAEPFPIPWARRGARETLRFPTGVQDSRPGSYQIRRLTPLFRVLHLWKRVRVRTLGRGVILRGFCAAPLRPIWRSTSRTHRNPRGYDSSGEVHVSSTGFTSIGADQGHSTIIQTRLSNGSLLPELSAPIHDSDIYYTASIGEYLVRE